MIDNPLLAAFALLALVAIAAVIACALFAFRRRKDDARRELAELVRLQAETAVRIDAMRDMLAGRQAELHRAVDARLDSVTHHLSQSMTSAREQTVESLQKLN